LEQAHRQPGTSTPATNQYPPFADSGFTKAKTKVKGKVGVTAFDGRGHPYRQRWATDHFSGEAAPRPSCRSALGAEPRGPPRARAAALEGRSVVLDGELVAHQGRPFDFYGLGPRLSAHAPASVARRRAQVPVTFAAFDVLYLDGETVTRLPYLERRALLEGLGLTGPRSTCST
jgi:hypothetical protein